MTDFEDAFEFGAFETHLAQFGEQIVYLPRGRAPRTILAVVNNNPVTEQLSGVQKGRARKWVIQVENDPVRGITTDEIDTGGDKVRVHSRAGDGGFEATITLVLDDTGGITEFEARGGQLSG